MSRTKTGMIPSRHGKEVLLTWAKVSPGQGKKKRKKKTFLHMGLEIGLDLTKKGEAWLGKGSGKEAALRSPEGRKRFKG